MKTQLKSISAFVLMMISTSLYAQENFRADDLAFLENVAFNLKSNSVKNFMKEKGYTYKEKSEAFDVTQYLFEDSKKTTTAIVGFTPSDKLYSVQIKSPLTQKNALTGFELEQFHGFEISDENDIYTEWKKEGYPFYFLVSNNAEEGRIILLTTKEFSFNRVKDEDRPVTINKLKELIGYKSESVKELLKKKKYYFIEEFVEDEGYKSDNFVDKNFKNEIDVVYRNKLSVGAGFIGITKEEYEHLFQWLKSNEFLLKQQGEEGMIKTKDLWESNDGNWRLVVDYVVFSRFEPTKIMLYKTH